MVNLVPDSALPSGSSFGSELRGFAAANNITLHSVDGIGKRQQPASYPRYCANSSSD